MQYEGMDAGVIYSVGEGGSGLDQQMFTGENGVLRDGDGDVIQTDWARSSQVGV